MNKKNKKLLLDALLVVFIMILVVCFNVLKNTYAYSSIVYRDDGYIELYADDLVNLNEDEYEKVVQLTFRTYTPNQENMNLLNRLTNVESIYFYQIDIDDVTFINEIDSNSDINLYIVTSTIDFKNINNDDIKSINIGNSVVKNFKSIEDLTSLKQISFSEMSGYEKIDYSKFSNLEELTLTSYVDDFAELIDSIPNVKSLSLAATNIQDKDTQYLKRLTNLTYLNLNQTYLTDIDFVNDLPNLEELILPWAVTDLSPVYNLENLKSLEWEAYTELFVTQDLVDYLDEKHIEHFDYNPNIKSTINNIISSLAIDENTSTKESLEKIVRYIIEHTGTDLSNITGNNSTLDIIINQNNGVCYHHSIALYTIAKVLGINDIYATSGILMKLTDITLGNEFNEIIDHNFYEPHAWNIVNIDGIWYGIDAAQMNENTLVVNETLFEANFLKNPFKDDDYDLNYARENYYDFNYFFFARHDETDGTLMQTQTFEFENITNLNIKNHVIYNYDINDTQATSLCSRVLENYNCSYYDVDENNMVSTGDKVVITKNNVVIDTFILNTASYVAPLNSHLGGVRLEYDNYPDVEISNGDLDTQHFNSDSSLKVKVLGEDFYANKMYDSKIEIIDLSNNEIVYTITSSVSGQRINEELSFSINSTVLTAKVPSECGRYGCDADYLISVYVNNMKRDTFIRYMVVEKEKYSITINSNDNISYPSDVINIEENGAKNFELSANLGYRIVSIKINGVESIDNYKDNKLLIENVTENINIDIETTPEEYEFTEGNNSVYLNKEMIFKTNGPLEIFSNLYLNEKQLDSKYYKLEKGSTIITLSNEYLKTLQSGSYKLVANYSNGTTTTTTFTINDNNSKLNGISNGNIENVSSNPKTSDNILKYIILGCLSLTGIILIMFIKTKEYIKNKRNNN